MLLQAHTARDLALHSACNATGNSTLDSKLTDVVIKLHISICMSPYFPKIKNLISESYTTFKKTVLKTQPITSKLAMSLAPHLEWRFTANEVLPSAHKPSKSSLQLRRCVYPE